jgi:AAA+ ATPase superfamily predicted ATPase
MAMEIIGRKREKADLQRLVDSGRPEFVAIYGRRRVGKTYLVKEFFGDDISFQLTGSNKATNQQQLENFDAAMLRYGVNNGYRLNHPTKTWFEAFAVLREFLEFKLARVQAERTQTSPDILPSERRLVIFIDEMPWLDRQKSGFVAALEHFWNDWGSSVPELLLIVCGSAASWIIRKLLEDRGGLHNRLTYRILLEPFTLKECDEYLAWRKVALNRLQVLEAYMIVGGIPYYLSLFKREYALTQNIDSLFFGKTAPLKNEYAELLGSLFQDTSRHKLIIETLTQRRGGFTREELIAQTGLPNGGSFTRTLAELEQCGFIAQSSDFTKPQRGVFFRLVDPFMLFYLRFVQNNTTKDEYYWTNYTGDASYRVWSGLAFEQLCELHVQQIKKALGIYGVSTHVASWRSSPGHVPGAQIDLLIDRRDDVINICEMKFAKTPHLIDKRESEDLQRRIQVFADQTGTRKALHLTMVTPYGLASGSYSGAVQSQVTMDDLFA